MGKLYIIMGKSSSGKDTIYKQLTEKLGDRFHPVITYTTRPVRTGEKNGVEYFFVTEEEYHTLHEQGKIVEKRVYQTFYGPWYYFTVNDGQIDLENYDSIMVNTLEAYEQMKAYYGEDVVVPIYIEVESGERLYRALCREREQKNPKYTELCRRFIADEEDFSTERLLQSGINQIYENSSLEKCLEKIMKDITKE